MVRQAHHEDQLVENTRPHPELVEGIMPGSQAAAMVGGAILTTVLYPALAKRVLQPSGAEKAIGAGEQVESQQLMLWTAFHPSTRTGVLYRREAGRESTMTPVAIIGLDIAKSVFQVHGVDAAGQVVIRRRLMRGRVLAFFEKLKPCLVGIEACSSSHYWARELMTRGHDVRLLPAQYVKPYVKRGKNDAADAEAICEAVARPTMRFVPIKTTEQQSVMMLHR
jgi:hypothetical protein